MYAKIRMLMVSLVALGASSFASADALVTVKSEVVRYDDLRIISNVGAAVLYGRLRSAAERVCFDVMSPARNKACVDATLAKAVADVNHPLLTQYVESRRGKIPGVAAVAKGP